METRDDRLPLWWLVRSIDMPRHQLVPLLRKLELPIIADEESGEFYSSRTAFRELLIEVAE